MSLTCPICGSPLRERFRAQVLHRHEAIYDQCADCGLLKVRQPHWLAEAYSDAIAITDTGLMARNLVLARQMTTLCDLLERVPGESYLDYAGGYGVFTRLMRDAGFDFRWLDPYCRNLHAPGFEYAANDGPCRLVTAFEVIEHVEDPRSFVETALAAGQADTLVFTTELYTGEPLPPDAWWYYALETGQHIAFFRRDTLARLAETLGMQFHSSHGLHIISRDALPVARIDRALSRPGQLLARFNRRRRPGLIWADHQEMSARLQQRAADADRDA
jgi:hypothetical protein